MRFEVKTLYHLHLHCLTKKFKLIFIIPDYIISTSFTSCEEKYHYLYQLIKKSKEVKVLLITNLIKHEVCRSSLFAQSKCNKFRWVLLTYGMWS